MRTFTNSGTEYQKTQHGYTLKEDYEYSFYKPIKIKWIVGSRLPTNCNCCKGKTFKCIYHHKLFCLSTTTLIACCDYSWDGPSGPTIDTRNSLRASLVHDVLYQAMREKGIKFSYSSRKWADKIFLKILKEDGMGIIRRRLWYFAVRLCGKSNAEPD